MSSRHDSSHAAIALRQLICGEWRPGRGDAPVLSVNPADPDETVAQGIAADEADVETAVRGVHDYQPAWAAETAHIRCEIMRAVADAIEASADELTRLACAEVGKPVAESRAEALRAAEIFRYFAAEALRPVGAIYSSASRAEHIEATRRPIGLAALVTPFNFPLALPAWKLAAALVYGNGVVWKPSEHAAATSQRLLEVMLQAGLPSEIIALLHGTGDAGRALVADGRVNAVSFTGSTPVGRSLIADAGRRAVPVQAEMGGSNAAVVLADADMDLAAREIIAGGLSSCGQRCTATARVVCDADVYERLVERLVDEVSRWLTGDPAQAEVKVGPVISADARARVHAAATGALDAGSSLLATAPMHHDAASTGYYVQPQLIEITDLSNSLWTEEVFGPVIAITPVVGRSELIEAARHPHYGLSAAVFTDSITMARQLEHTLDVGVMHVNSATTGAAPHVPFGGVNGSGFGPMEQGAAAKEFYTRRHVTYIRGGR